MGGVGAWRKEVATQLRGDLVSDMAAMLVGQQLNTAAGGNKNKKGKKVSETRRRGNLFSLRAVRQEGSGGRMGGWGGVKYWIIYMGYI